MKTRRRIRQVTSLKERLTIWAESVRAEAARLTPGPQREALLQRASQADTAAHIDDWVNSTGLQPPR
jgi:hypothetical protein